jgi:predicted AAA+ superfamily ATPase
VGQVQVAEKNRNGNPVRKYLEVDFVVNRGSKRYYIQSSAIMDSDEKQQQEMASLQNIDDSFKKIIITHSEQKPWYNQQGILILALHDFLLDDNSIEY